MQHHVPGRNATQPFDALTHFTNEVSTISEQASSLEADAVHGEQSDFRLAIVYDDRPRVKRVVNATVELVSPAAGIAEVWDGERRGDIHPRRADMEPDSTAHDFSSYGCIPDYGKADTSTLSP